MELSKEHIEKFKDIYKKRFGETISDEEAREKGSKLIRLIKAVYKPITKNDFDKLRKRREETKE